MTKYVKWLAVFVCALSFFTTDVDALKSNCPADVKKELSQIATHIKVNYEIVDNSEEKDLSVNGQSTKYKIPNYAFAISIYNITQDFSVRIETASTDNKMSQTVYYDDAYDGTYTFYDYNIGDIYNYTITVRSTRETCTGTTFRTFKFTKPRYNAYSEYTYCQNSTSFYCQRFVSSELNIKDTADFLNKIKVNNEKNNPNKNKIDTKKEIVDTLKSNWKVYLLLFVIIAGLIVGIIFGLKKHREKKGWKL